jgi:para-nitrobenzyl esterase
MQKIYKVSLLTIFFISSHLFSNDSLEIHTSSGTVTGMISNKVISWDDIPYAEPPIGDLRWKAPRDYKNYSNIIISKDYNFCVQEPSTLGGAEGNDEIVGTEDCLYLDIKAPTKKSEKLLPVMFWIHGGGNISGLKDIYDFSPMIKKHDVIVVSTNYRLGPFGWFTHPSIQKNQNGLDKTSNFGTLDIIKALEWVNKNIILFGGDPSNVTIFGESAGGHNVLSLLVASQARGLFHKAISQSGYTTSVDLVSAYKQDSKTTYTHTSEFTVNKLLKKNYENKDVYSYLMDLSAYDFFSSYVGKYNSEIPLLTNDGIVIPKIGLKKALGTKDMLNNVPLIAGSNRDEVKLWIGLAEYFVEVDFSIIGSIFGIPRVKLKDEDSFEAFNYYRSNAWQLRGVIEPLSSLHAAGNYQTYSYRYDWDDHRKFIIADFQKLFGAAHATEIPLLTGNNKLVGDYGFLLYPIGPSKKFTSKNMMRFWTNFAKFGEPGESSNQIKWEKYSPDNKNFIILDKKRNMRVIEISSSYKELIEELNEDTRVNNIEKCVILYQMGSLVGNDIFDKLIKYATFSCKKSDAIRFLDDNDSFIEY